ncbi:lipoate--protein ligase family protein [Planctomicrobium sp. SH664]|uniref:lipoate--protein ligase family protein n=1 Tax=Planctomicrobium sp. SH664 TaxID=3448125 RepID=UPI003F5CA843
MAVDESLLQAATGGIASLRFYQWASPTVSLGHFQANHAESTPARFRHLEVVRRLSGGGAILHDRELTYSCAIPATHSIARVPGTLYDEVHAAILETLAEFGVRARLRGAEAFADQSFLCFSRGDARDIVIGSQKIVGSAQRRRAGAILQHGSILLEQSPEAPEFPGIREITGIQIPVEELRGRLLPKISTRLRFPQNSSQSATS